MEEITRICNDYAITAGHVIKGGPGHVDTIMNRRTDKSICATALSCRYPDPRSRMAQECGISKVRKEDVTKVDAVIPRLDFAYNNEGPSK
jgi:hypothetical protein